MSETVRNRVGLRVGEPLPGSADNGGPGVLIRPDSIYGDEMDDLDNRWREGPWGKYPDRVPMHVKEALHLGWSAYFALIPAKLVDGKRAWFRWIERREVHAPPWFLTGHIIWQEYRERPRT